MFNDLGERLRKTVGTLRGRGRLSEDNIRDALREVRVALLEADVALPVVKEFIGQVQERAVGTEVLQSLAPGQVVVKIVRDELVELMGRANDSLDLAVRPPAVILVAGLQGAGKTTTVAKLGRFLRERHHKRVLTVSTDVYRPAAMEQLARLAETVGVENYPSHPDDKPVAIAEAARDHARRAGLDVVLVDTAGRLHVDAEMMAEVRQIHQAMVPAETLFVVDSTTGQDAVNSAQAFDAALALTGIVLTKTDGDARGGAALSIRKITGKPIKFLGTGEASDALEPFFPDRVASRILGMGDVVSLVEDVERQVDRDQADRLARKIGKGKGLDLEDFREQLLQMEKMGGLASLMDKLPGMHAVPEAVKRQADDSQTRRLVAIISSMTSHERRFPAVIRGSRKRRIAQGSGTQVQDVNRLLKQFAQMQKMMKRMGRKGNMSRMMGQMKRNGMPQFPM